MLAQFQEASSVHIEGAAAAAAAAFDAYRATPADARATFLDRIATTIEKDDDLIDAAHAETALPRQRLAGERARTANQLRMFASLVREGLVGRCAHRSRASGAYAAAETGYPANA
jgi:NADP-dependent aldehyde dehydrogenase